MDADFTERDRRELLLLALAAGGAFMRVQPEDFRLLEDFVNEDKPSENVERAARYFRCYGYLGAPEHCERDGMSREDIAAGRALYEADKLERIVDERVGGAPEFGRKA